MLHSLLIAQLLGFFLLFMGIILLARAEYYKAMFGAETLCPISVFFASVMGLILGILLVLVHNLWLWGPSVIITLLAWLILVKSLLWLAFPERMLKVTHRLYSGYAYYVMALIALILGVILLSHGCYLFME